MNEPEVSIVVNQDVPASSVADMERDISSLSISSQVRQIDDGRPWAMLEWLVPTALILMFSKSYVETVASKMAEDHYAFAKKIGHKLWEKCFGPKRSIELVLRRKDGARKESVFCMGASIRATSIDGIDVTLLFLEGASSEEIVQGVAAFHSLLAEVSAPSALATAVSRLPEMLHEQRQLVYLDPATKSMRIVDWFSSSRDGELVSMPI